jgi:hypothetical protein
MKKYLILLLGLIIYFSSCKKETSSDPLPNNNNNSSGNISSPCQFSCTFDGVNYSAVEGVNNYLGLSIHSASSSSNPIEHSYLSFIYSSPGDLPYLSIGKGTIYTNSGDPDTSAVLNFYSPGNVNYSISADDGIFIGFSIDTNQSWGTDTANLYQAGSTFIIDQSVIKYDSLMQLNYIKVKARFNCRLTGIGGVTKDLTNGVAVFKVYPDL